MAAVNYDWDELADNIDEEYDDTGNTIAEYTTEPALFGNVISQRRSGQSSFLHCDGLGSTLALTSAAGAVTDTNAYSAFGEVTEQTGSTVNPFRYIGQKAYYKDEITGEYRVRRRSLTVRCGRWLSPDPQLLDLAQYLYVTNRPVTYRDPSGLDNVAGVADDSWLFADWDVVSQPIYFTSGDIVARFIVDASLKGRPKDFPIEGTYLTNDNEYLGVWVTAEDKHKGEQCAHMRGVRVWLQAAFSGAVYVKFPDGTIVPRPPDLPSKFKWYYDYASVDSPPIPWGNTVTDYHDFSGHRATNKRLDIYAGGNAMYVDARVHAVSIACVCKDDTHKIIRDPGIISTLVYGFVIMILGQGVGKLRSFVAVKAMSVSVSPQFWAGLEVAVQDVPNPLSVVDDCC